MSYGHGSPRRLRYLVDQLRGYVALHISQPRKPLSRASGMASLPPALQLAFVRGEALLKVRFFEWCDDLAFGLDAPDQALALYDKLIGNRGLLVNLVNRIGLFGALASQTALPQADAELAFKIYCGLLDDLRQSENFRLLDIATVSFFEFGFRGLFPQQAATPRKTNDVTALRHSAQRKLRKALKQPVELKESFVAGDNRVDFHLRLKVAGHWHHLPNVRGTRLKPTRLAAYEALITLASSGNLQQTLSAMPAQQKMARLAVSVVNPNDGQGENYRKSL